MVGWGKEVGQGRGVAYTRTHPCGFLFRVGVLVPRQSFESVGGGEGDLLLL